MDLDLSYRQEQCTDVLFFRTCFDFSFLIRESVCSEWNFIRISASSLIWTRIAYQDSRERSIHSSRVWRVRHINLFPPQTMTSLTRDDEDFGPNVNSTSELKIGPKLNVTRARLVDERMNFCQFQSSDLVVISHEKITILIRLKSSFSRKI